MKTVIDSVIGFFVLLGVGAVGTYFFCHAVKKEAVSRVSQKLHRHEELQTFTQKLMGRKLSP